jgi:hypothetical protein
MWGREYCPVPLLSDGRGKTEGKYGREGEKSKVATKYILESYYHEILSTTNLI